MSQRRRTALVDLLESRLLFSTTRVAVIGDYGADTTGNAAQELSVASLVKGWDTATAPLNGIVTTGDNNYNTGEWSSIDQNIGKYYADYIGNYVGTYGTGAATNRFFPSLGNHDWASTVDHDGDGAKGADPYLDYFTLPEGTPGNERYYEFQTGPVHFFALDSDPAEPDGKTASSAQAQWLRQRLATSTAPWQVVYFHHAAYSSSSNHGSDPAMQWPFASWGADVVLTGHDHQYERLQVDGIPYFVNGSGGRPLYGFSATPLAESQARYNADYGAQLIEADDTRMTISFYNSGYQQAKTLVDTITLDKNAPPPPPPAYSTTAFQQNANGYTGTVDTQVRQANAADSYGSGTFIKVDTDEPANSGKHSQGLVRFGDIFGTGSGQVPAGSEIVSAKLDVGVYNAGHTVNLHRMLSAWSGAATWNSLGSGVQANGVEAVAAPDASFTTGTTTGTYSIEVTSSLRAWVADPSSNLGWAFLPTNTDGVEFYTSEGAVAPKLVVNYKPPANLPVVTVAADDDDAAEPVSLGDGQYALDNGRYTVTRTGDTSADLVVNYSVGGSASTADFETLSGMVTIPTGQTAATIDLIVRDDLAYEGEESVVLTLAADPAYRVGSPGSFATVHIADNETPPPVVTVSATDPSASEEGDAGEFTISRTGDTSAQITVYYAVAGTATAGADYTPLGGSAVIAAGESSVVVALTPNNDAAYEGDEGVRVTLSAGEGYTLGAATSATVTVADDELPLPTVSISATDASAAESGDAGEFTISRTGDTTAAITVYYSVAGTAAAGVDYEVLAGSAVMLAGQTSVTVPITPVDDPAYEGDEAVEITLTSGDGYTLGTATSASVKIADNELPPPVVTISATDSTAAEAGDTATYTVSRAGDTTAALDVSYSVAGTATAGSDYTALQGVVTIPAGLTTATFSVVPINDTVYEANETVVVTLADGASYDLGSPQSATATITSDDAEPIAPAAPTELKGTAVNGGRINLSWKDNSTNETGFVLESSLDGKTWTAVTLATNTSTYSKTGLAKSTFYYFRVKAVNTFGDSVWSNVLKIRSAAK